MFEYFLCAELGGMTVEEMRHRMSGAEFQAWGLYFALKAQRLELEQNVAKARMGR